VKTTCLITPGEIKDLACKLYPNAGPATRNRQVIAPARAIINFAAERGLCPPIRVRNLPVPKVPRPAGDREWIDAFRAHCPSPHLRTLILFMFVTGARVGEAVKLAPGHLDLETMSARIQDTKNGDPRTAYLTDELVAELRALEPRRIHYGRGPLRVFGYSDRRSFHALWDRTIEAAGIKRLTPHEAGRHGFGTEMIVRKRVDVATTAEMGGWRDPRVLLETYAHPENLSDVAEAMFGRSTAPVPVTPLAQRRGKAS
jgi:integrase